MNIGYTRARELCYETEVAIADAPEIIVDPRTNFPEGEVEQKHESACFAYTYPDEFEFQIPPEEEDFAGQITVPTPGEFLFLLNHIMTNDAYDGDGVDAEKDRLFRHETAHAMMRERLSPDSSHVYYVQFYDTGEQVGGRPAHLLETGISLTGLFTKIQIGRIFAAPDDPSDGDIAIIRGFGYDLDELKSME